jgi:hypothetical protein
MKRSLGSNAIPLFIIAALIAINAGRGMFGISTHLGFPLFYYGYSCNLHHFPLKHGYAPLTEARPCMVDTFGLAIFPHAASIAPFLTTCNDLLDGEFGHGDLPFPDYTEVWYCPVCRALHYAWERGGNGGRELGYDSR